MSKGNSAHHKKTDIQDLYINTHYSKEEIGDFFNVSVRTIQRYAEAGNWDELKAAKQLTKPKVIANLYKRMLQLSEDDAIENAQKIAMLAGALDKIDKKASATHYLQVFKHFNQHLIDKGEIALAKTFNIHQSSFLENLTNRSIHI